MFYNYNPETLRIGSLVAYEYHMGRKFKIVDKRVNMGVPYYDIVSTCGNYHYEWCKDTAIISKVFWMDMYEQFINAAESIEAW